MNSYGYLIHSLNNYKKNHFIDGTIAVIISAIRWKNLKKKSNEIYIIYYLIEDVKSIIFVASNFM